ncbi:hypothetical protein OX284_006340 [Flavobacterium sp. SUN046]|uniref:hypothetical protein n=1 Tax=Flavobacterium sp. SUN046 TaxID=3002440 RepID=UPI002DBDB68A|nr:hypothetical protein [Flavobacterium sp. SUN046]MEC4049040.1 hypothetical protein [Flavobacterium sp. SUN046]
MKPTYYLFIATSLISCTADSTTDYTIKVISYIDLTIKDHSGRDLLATETTNTLNTNTIKLFYLINDVVVEVNNTSQPFPRNYFIYQYNNSNTMRVFLNDNRKVDYPITYIQWNDSDTDTIACHYKTEKQTNATIISPDAVWYNNKLVYPTPENQDVGRYISLVK